MIITCYFKLRLKQLFRILIGIGPFRSLFLFGLLFLLFYLLVKINNGWIIPMITILGLSLYHNERKDKSFLSLHTKQTTAILRIEYLLIGLPFILIECLKGYWLEAGTIGLSAIFLPLLRTIKHKIPVIPLPFLYKGGLEYIRMFRLYGWIYPFLLLIGLIGVSHGNIRLVKVLLILWGIIQGAAFTNRPKRQELTYFLNLSTFQKYLILSNAWNVTVTSIPLIGIMLSFSCNWENILFAVSALTGSTLYLWNLGMAQYIFSSTITMTIYQLTILIPLFFYACFMPFLLIILMVINIVFYLFIKNDSKSIWN